MTPTHPAPDPTPPTSAAPAPTRDRGLRRGLWIALAIGLVANVITVITVDNPLYSSGIGLFVLLCAAGLGVLALRRGPRAGGAA